MRFPRACTIRREQRDAAMRKLRKALSTAEGRAKVVADPKKLPTVKADPVKLRQVFQNLAANALQATEASRGERTIDIESRFVHKKSGAFVQITITNSGIELDKQTKDQAFEPFFTTRAKGTGLGLAIVKNHVLRHGGQVNIESSDGVIKVCVALPLSPPASLFKESISRGERSLMHAVNEESRTYGTHSDH